MVDTPKGSVAPTVMTHKLRRMKVLNYSGNRICRISAIVALFASFALTACHPKPQQNGSTSRSGADLGSPNDSKIVERTEKMRSIALKTPGGAIEANNFASHVTMLYSQGVAKRRPVSPTLVDEAVKCLDMATEANPEEAPDLLARKGELLLEAGQNDLGATALHDSIEIRPTLRAFTRLAKFYKTQNKTAEIEALCKKTLPAMKSDESRYAVIDDCLKSSGAVTTDAGLRWASAKDISFYKARRKELEARLAAAKQQRAKEEQKEEKKR
jgi:hypothetical protein